MAKRTTRSGSGRKPVGTTTRKPAPPKQPPRSATPQAAAATSASPRAASGTVRAPIVRLPDQVLVPVAPSYTSNLFQAGKPGRAVVRAEDLLAIRIELRNLAVTPGTPPRLRKSGTAAAHLILHFPPQSITEETFFETRPAGTTNPKRPDGTNDKDDPPGGTETPKPPPVRARIAGESRLAFAVPDGFDIPYTLEGVLAACRDLALSVPANAAAPGSAGLSLSLRELFAADVARLDPRQRRTLTSFALRTLRVAAVQGDTATLHLRQLAGGVGVAPIGRGLITIPLDPGPIIGPRPRLSPRPAEPGATQTAIELPWRLILAPHAGERWRHATLPVTSPATQRTELWHSRLVAPDAKGGVIEPPKPDSQRTVRAVWALIGEGSPKPMQGTFPTSADLPAPNTSPFRMPLDDFDRFQITHLSSNFSVSNYAPQPIGANLLMLSSLGAWLDSRGGWEPPGLSVEEWVHRASMGRDHYVRVVYKGFLFPFGHRVALVKVSERKFHNGALGPDGKPVIEQTTGNVAYLRQRLFIVVRERERRFVDPGLTNNAGTVNFQRQFPFSSVRILTLVTPNLDQPNSPAARIGPNNDQRLFWPCVNGAPFAFQCVATDIDGKPIQFALPMIFMDNTMASPRTLVGNTLQPDFPTAEANAAAARAAWRDASRADRRVAAGNQQRVAFAPSLKPGDTSAQVTEVHFDAEVEANNAKLRTYSQKLQRPVFYPKLEKAKVRITPIAQLGGSNKTNTIAWNAHYLQHGFGNNKGEVFADVVTESGMAQLDFSAQGDRSGGFVQPNIKPNALSRFAGPVMGDVGQFIQGKTMPGGGFPTSLSDLPLPLLFGCIPLGELIKAVSNLTESPEKIPKFASEASTQVESFINGLIRLIEFISNLADQPGRIADAALGVFKATLADLLDQAKAYAAAQVADVKTKVNELTTALTGVAGQVQQLFDKRIDAAPTLGGLAGAVATAQTRVAALKTAANAQVGGVSLPAGFRQGLLTVAGQLETFLADLQTIVTLITQGKALYTALDNVVGDPSALGSLFENPGELATRIDAVKNAIGPLKGTLGGFRLLDGAPRKVILDAMSTVEQVLAGAADLLKLLEMLTGDDLTVRFDWNPPIDDWGFEPGAPLFRANDKRGFLVAVEAKIKKNGSSAPRIGVVCSLKHFDLVLIAPASFIELNFEKIEFSVDIAAKMNVDVLLSDIKFVGPLSFVETLRDLIPLDGFSDPPSFDISPQGIDASFSVALPSISIGVLSLSNLSLGAGFTVPFIGQPLSVRFNFCTREQPFTLTVYMFGGGGFFGITIDPHGVQILEAAFEFGASLSIDFGVASGGVHVMAGIYFRMEQDAASLTGYFRLGGRVDVLGIITASIELYLELRYEFQTGKCVGKAKLTIEISVFIFSGSVTITCERKFAGSNGDPTFREMVGFDPSLSLADELAQIDTGTSYAWRDYCEAFA